MAVVQDGRSEGDKTYICGKWKSHAIKAANAVTTSSGIGKHTEKGA
jgi:hypothetical protein